MLHKCSKNNIEDTKIPQFVIPRVPFDDLEDEVTALVTTLVNAAEAPDDVEDVVFTAVWVVNAAKDVHTHSML